MQQARVLRAALATGALFLAAWSAHRLGHAEHDAHLLSLTAVHADPESGVLRVHGEGFPPGAEGELVLEGSGYLAGEPPRPLALHLRARAEDSGTAQATISQAALGQPAEVLFEGELALRFRSKLSDGWVVGRLPVHALPLDAPRAEADMRAQLALNRRSQAFQKQIGVAALQQTDAGLIVKRLNRGGVAARAGLAQGDVIRRIDGGPVRTPRDLIPRRQGPDVELMVRAPFDRAPRRVQLQLPGVAAQLHPTVQALALVLACLMAVLIPAGAHRLRTRLQLDAATWLKAVLLMGLSLLASLQLTGALDVWLIGGAPLAARLGVTLYGAAKRSRSAAWISNQLTDVAIGVLALTALSIPAPDPTGSARSCEELLAQPLAALMWPSGWLAALCLAQAHRVHASAEHETALLRAFGVASVALVLCSFDPLGQAPLGYLLARLLVACGVIRLVVRLALPRGLIGLLATLAPALALWQATATPSAPWLSLATAAALGICLGRMLGALGRASLSRAGRGMDPALHPFL